MKLAFGASVFWVYSIGFRFLGFGYRVQGFGVQGFGFRV